MDYTILEKSTLFKDIPAKQLRNTLENVHHHIECYDKGETIFHLMEEADRVGIILEGCAEAQKPFPNGSQINVSIRMPGDMIGPAAVFSKTHRYPCDVVATMAVTVMIFRKKDLLSLLQKDMQILENFTTEIASATYMLQQRLEMFSYSGIAQKAAYYLLVQSRQLDRDDVPIPGSISKWALIMNVSRSSLHRELKKLEESKIISYSSHLIRIKDKNALQNILGK